jgi:hypothetical protein
LIDLDLGWITAVSVKHVTVIYRSGFCEENKADDDEELE